LSLILLYNCTFIWMPSIDFPLISKLVILFALLYKKFSILS
jgi:hypothetical protein